MGRLIGEAYIALLPDDSLFRSKATADINRALAGVRGKVDITGDTSDADKKIAAVAAALKGLKGEAKIETRGAIRDIAALQAATQTLRGRLENMVADVNNSKSMAALYSMISRAEVLQEKLGNMEADMSISKVLAEFYTIDARADDFREKISNLTPDMDLAHISAQFTALGSAVSKLSEELDSMRANVDDSRMLAKIVAAQAQVLKLAKKLENMPMTADTLPFQADMYKAAAMVEALKREMGDIQLTPVISKVAPGAKVGSPAEFGSLARVADTAGGMAAYGAMAKIAGMDTAYLNRQLNETGGPVSALVAAGLTRIARGQSMIIGNATGWGAWNNQIRLFGGALDRVLPTWARAISLWHLGLDVLFEFAAAWAPAMIAVGAFAAYAYPVGEKIYGQWKNINTILDGVGGRLPDLGTQFDVIQRAIEPSILAAFGEYMLTIGKNAGPLGAALAKVGQVVDVWGAGLVSWSNKALRGFDNIVNAGSKDFAMIGEGFHQVFRILSSFFHDMPGFVHGLLALGDAFLTVTANVIQFASPLLKAGLWIHGFMIYVGLAVTAMAALSRTLGTGFLMGMSRMGATTREVGKAAEESSGKFSKFATGVGLFAGTLAGGITRAGRYTGDLFKLGDGVEKMGVKARIARAGTRLWGDALSLITKVPVAGWAVAAAVVVGTVLYFALRRSTSAAQQFQKAMNDLVAGSSAANIQQNIQVALDKTSAAIQRQTAALHGVNVQMAATYGRGQIQNTARDLQTYQATLGQVAIQANNYGSRMNQLAHVFGSTAGAQAALNLMGIKSGTIATENNKAWSVQLIELQGLAKGYGYMGQQAGAAGAQLNTLNIASGTTTKNVQALQQAESGWITMVTSGDTAFTQFEQGQNTLNEALKKGAQSAGEVRVQFGHIRETYSLAGASMNGTSQAALAARQAFDQQVSAGTTLYGNLQMLATAGGNTASAQHSLAKSGKDIIAQLLPMAAGSKQATAEVYALAQVVGYTGKDSFPALAKWVGHTKGAEADLNNQQSKLTIGMAKLSTAARNLGNALTTEVTQSQAAAIAKTANLTGATQSLANAANKAHGQVSKMAVSAAGEYVASLTKAGLSTNTAKQYLNAYLKQLGYSSQQISAIDANLHDSTGQWNKYDAAVQRNTKAAQANAKATNANYQSFAQLEGVLPGSTAQLDNVWRALVKQDSAMVTNGKHAADTKAAFISLAENGFHLTAKQAQDLWAKFSGNNLDYLATHAAQTKAHFIDFAQKGLHLTSQQANALWGMFAQNNLDLLVTKGDKAKNKFIDFARHGLDLTAAQANNLWSTLAHQYLDTVAHKAGETKKAFEKTASQFGYTKQSADKLWSSLHQLAAGSPYKVNVNETLTGHGKLTAAINGSSVTIASTGAGAASQANIINASNAVTKAAGGVRHHARGWQVPAGAAPAGQDGHLAVLAPGELVIPTSHAARFGAMAKKAGIPGLAGGGIVGNFDHNSQNAAHTAAMGVPTMQNGAVKATLNGMQQFAGVINGLMNQITASMMGGPMGGPMGGMTGSSMANGRMLYLYLLNNVFGGNKIAAAGATASIWGESMWNPYAQGTGGRGLIGWTPPGTISDTAFKGGMATQLPMIIRFISTSGDWGVINAMKSAGSVSQAAWMWGKGVERFGIPDVHPEGIALATSFMNGASAQTAQNTSNTIARAGRSRPHSAGGMVTEPVYGIGRYSGLPYSFAENGQAEYVGPLSGNTATAPVKQPMTATQGQTVTHQLATLIKLWQQFPQALGYAMNHSGGNGVNHGYYRAQY